MFAGEGGPERTNRRFHYVSHSMPAKRLSTAFDSVTLYGNDPDYRPDIYGKIGNAGVSICCLDDAKKLYSGFDLADPRTSVSMTIDDATHLDALLGVLTALGDVSVERNRGIVALVGAGLGDSTATMAEALGALVNIKVHMVSLSSGGINLTLLVDADQVLEAMRRLHTAFFPAPA